MLGGGPTAEEGTPPKPIRAPCQQFEAKGLAGGLRTWCRVCSQHVDAHCGGDTAPPRRMLATPAAASATPAAPPPPPAADDAADDDDALLSAREARLTASYERIYRQLVSTSSAAALGFDALEQAVATHNGAVLHYDGDMAARNRGRLAAHAGGWARLRRAGSGGGAAAAFGGGGGGGGGGGVALQDLAEAVRAAHQSVGNNSLNPAKHGSDYAVFATVAARGVVSAAEAAELRRAVDLVGFRPFIRTLPEATTGLSKAEPKRSHTSLVLHDTELAAWLWPRVEPLVRGFRPTFNYQRWSARCINPCFRCLRYGAGQVFETHTDDVYANLAARPAQRSFLTVVIYLNEGFEGGELRFVKTRGGGGDSEERVLATVAPTAGLTAVFEHDLLHEALPPSGDTPKYIMRTDVIFTALRK
jgi:hypothetical protein